MVKIKQILLVLLSVTGPNIVLICHYYCAPVAAGEGGLELRPIIQQKCSVWSGFFSLLDVAPQWGCKQKFPTKYKLETPTHCLH